MTLSGILVRAVNRQIRPGRRDALRAFAGRVVALRAGPLRANLRVSEDGEFAAVHSAVQPDAEVEVAAEFFQSALSGQKPQARVSGDSEFLRVVGETLRGAAMDLESNPAAAPVALGIRAVVRALEIWLPRAGSALVQNKTVADSDSVARFNSRVKTLARGVGRMESALAAVRRAGRAKPSKP